MNRLAVFLLGVLLGAAGGVVAGDRAWHWLDVQNMNTNGWVTRSKGADDNGRYTVLSSAEGNHVFLKRAYHSGMERNERGEVACEGAGSLKFDRSNAPTAYDNLPPGSVGRTLIDEVCSP